jgi:DNA-binding Lrp family transcriptional regulator
MPAKAYILLRTAPGLTKSIYNILKASPVIQMVEMITGPYDLIIAMEAANTDEILRTIMRDIRPAAGVRDTLTCLVIPGENVEQPVHADETASEED